MVFDTRHIEKAVNDLVAGWATRKEAIASIYDVFDDFAAAPGIARGLEAYERGDVMSSEQAQSSVTVSILSKYAAVWTTQ